jgi:hypothetical protein
VTTPPSKGLVVELYLIYFGLAQSFVDDSSVQGQNVHPVRDEGEMGSMPFDRTLRDWKKFNVAKRTEFDATIASGYAVMAVNRKPYMAPQGPKKEVQIQFQTYT